MSRQTWQAIALAVVVGWLASNNTALGAEPALKPKLVARKPAAYTLREHDSRTVLVVKFREGLTVRLADGRLIVSGTDARAMATLAAPAGVVGGQWIKSYRQSEAKLNQWRQTAQANLKREVADPNLVYRLRLPEGSDIAAVVNALNGLEVVEAASPSQQPAPPPLPPNFQPQEIYIEAAPPGVGAVPCWTIEGVTGQGVRIGDVEYNWILTHQDLPPVTMNGLTPALTDSSYTHHGLAVLGIMGAKNNGWGTTGIAPGAEFHVSTTWSFEFGDSIDSAIYALVDVMEPGDVILIEQQVFGVGSPGGADALVPVEFLFWNHDAIVTAVGNGIVVVEAAANGGVKLDPALMVESATGFFRPFHPGNDSGALIVGAGAAPPPYGTQQDASWLSFSNYGPTVDLQGWGQAVRTTGYGQLWSSEGVNLFYTNNFGGTSSASPMVAAAAALLQSAYKAARGVPLSPAAVRSILRATGTPQPSTGTGQPPQFIGPRPNVQAAILSVLDCDHNGVIDSIDIASHPERDCNGNGVLDSCELGPLTFASDELFPLGTGYPQSFSIENAPAAGGDVTLAFQAVGDLGFASESVSVDLNGTALGTIYGSGGHDCLQIPDEDSLIVSAASWNKAARRGPVVINMVSSVGVDAVLCPGGSWIKVKMSYPPAIPVDADGNGVLDECQTITTPGDLDRDGDVDGLDLALLLGGWGPCPAKTPCPADLNHDGTVNGIDLALLLGAWG